ncbi:hypothetical protein CWB56_18400, partial [Pseudoalteromonas sp. S185]|uniref:hypothetical protein n=1 Tax=Pseudoalteromonas sp. S185 TaxID=2066522 RepID=UPI001107AEA5
DCHVYGDHKTALEILVEESDDFDLDDIDSLIDEADEDSVSETQTESLVEENDDIDTALAGSVDDLADAQEELNVDDVESLASALIDESESENESEEEPELEDKPELVEEPELEEE